MNDSGIPTAAENLARYEAAVRAASESANAAGRMTLNALLLSSGGAVVALLAFLGNLLAKDTSHDYIAQIRVSSVVHAVAGVLAPFACAMVAAVVASALTYVAMFTYATAKLDFSPTVETVRLHRLGHLFNGGAIVCGLASLAALIVGAIKGLQMLGGL